MEEFRGMKRKELQALCKKRGVPANLTNREMADRLSSLFEENEKSVVQGRSNSDGSVERTSETGGRAAVRRNVKKVRFSPVDETFVFVSSNAKCTSREKRATARGSRNKRSLAVEKSRRRVVSVRTVQSPVRATRSRAQKVVDKDVPQVFSPGIRKKSRRGGVKVDMNEVQSVDVGDTRPELTDGTNCDNPQVEVVVPLRWHLRSRGVGVEKDGKVEHTTTENTRKNIRPTDFKKRKRNDTEGRLHSDDKPEDGSLAFVRAQQRKTTRHSKGTERGETDSKLSIEESEAVKSVGRITRSRASRVEGASTVKAINEIVECQGEIEKDVQLGQPPKIIGRRTRKSTAQGKDPPSENDGPEGQISDIFTERTVEKRKTKRMKCNAGTGSKSLLLGNELVNAEIAGSKLCFQKVSGLDASTIEAESRKSEVLEEHEEVDCLRHISNGSGKSVSRGKHSPVHKDKERNGLVLENKTRKRTKDTQDPEGKAIPSAILTDKEFIAHSTDRKNVRLSPYNRASEVETSAKEKSLKTLMTNALVHNSRVSSDVPAKQKWGKAPNGEMEYSEPSTEEHRTSRQSKRDTCKSEHGASMNSIVKADAMRQNGSATITEEVGARAKSAEMMDETLNIYVYLDVPAVLEHEDGLEKNGKADKAECAKNKGSDGKSGDITGVNSFDFYGVNIHLKDDLAAQSGNALVSAAVKSQEVDVKCGLEELPSESVVVNEKPIVLIADDRGKVQDSVNRSCQALGRAEDSIPEQVPSRAQIEDMSAVSHQDASLTLNLDSVDEPSDAALCLENKPETEHVYIGEHAYSRSVEELVLEDHMDECGQRRIAERVPVEADEHAHQIALLHPSSNEEQNQAYEANEVHVTNLGLQVGTFKTAIEDVVAIQLHNSSSTAPTGTPETLALGSGEANQIKTKSAVISSLQSNGHFGGDRYPSSETEFSSERAQPEQTVIDAEDGLCSPEKTTEEPGRKQRESQEPLESVEAAVAACDVTIDKVAEEKQSADGSFSLLNPSDAKITREKVYEVDEGSFDFAFEKPLGTRETSGKDLSMIPLDGCNTPVAKKCFLSYEDPLQKDSEKQGQDVKGQCPLLEECFCTFGEEIFKKPAFKSESDLSSMEIHVCPDELGSDTDEHKEKSPVMQSFESVFDETGKSCMETINAQAVGLVTSAEGIIAEDKGISSEMLLCIMYSLIAAPNTSEHQMSSSMNDGSKDNDGYEAGGNLDDEILSLVIDGNSLGQDNGFVVPNYSSQCLLDANSEENRFQVEEKSFFNSCDVNNIARPVVETEALIESVLEVISSRKDQREIHTFSPDHLADKDDIEEAVAQLNCGPEGMVALGKSSVDIAQSSNSEFAQFESLEKKGAVISLSLSLDGHKQEELDDGGQQQEIGNKVDKNLNFSDNQSANHSENLEMTEALEERNFDLIEVGNCHLPRAGGEDLNVQKEAVNFHQHCEGSICEVYEVGEEASSATVTIKAVKMINKEEDGSATSVFLQDRGQFHGDESTKIDLDTPIIPGVVAEDPKCNFNEVMGPMLHSDEQKIDPCDDQRGKSLRPDQKVPSEPISADVGIYVGTTESGLILKDIKTDTVQFDDDKLLEETHLDEVSSRMIETAPNANTHVEIVNTSHEDIIHTEDEPSALIMQENPATFNLEDGSMPAGETTMSLHGMSTDYDWDKTNSVCEHLVVHTCDEPNKVSDSYAAPPLNVVSFPGEEYPSKANNVDIGTNAKEKSDGDKEEVIVQEAHEPQEDHAVVGNARDFNHSSKACREVAKECARDNEVASVQTDLVLCESSHAKYKRIVKHNEESHGSGRLDEPATESRQLSANADSSSDFSLISSIGDPAILENKLLESQVESQTFTSWEMSFVFRDNSVDSKDVTEDHCSNCPATDEFTIKSDKESTEQEVSAMIQEYMDREKLEDGSLEVRASCVDSREKELAHVNASDCAPSDVFPIVHDPSDIRKEHLTFSSYANENVELGTKQEKETIIPNSTNYTPASVNFSAKLDVAENVRMQQLNPISPMTKSLDVKMEEPGKLINSSMVGRTKARSNFIEKTPKKLLAVSDMKENMPSTKWEQVGSVTASKTTKTRRVLEDLQRKQI
ncbi:hypothetical protein NL676_026397 [Syzygium grande]|nr:hypothetical protein NL676_026397 [Syzygium grande]